MSRSSIALVNLRAVVILIVLAFHSVLPYLASLPAAAYPFDSAPYPWLAFPIVDSQRWFGFDLFCAWQDVGLMTLMFFLSGLFVPSSLARKGSWKFSVGPPAADWLAVRAGRHFSCAARLLCRPIARPPSTPARAPIWQHWLALPFWPCGPQWFLGELLAFNILAAAMHRFVPGWDRASCPAGGLCRRKSGPVLCRSGDDLRAGLCPPGAGLFTVRMDEHRSHLVSASRPLHYLVYFLAGVAVGTYGLDRGLLDCDGVLARRWPAWLAAAFAGFLLWAAPTSVTTGGLEQRSPDREIRGRYRFCCRLRDGLPVLAGGLLALCALARAGVRQPVEPMPTACILIHYVFAVWLQYALLGTGLFAIGKAAIVFGGTLIMSWAIAAAMGGALPVSRLNATIRGVRRA